MVHGATHLATQCHGHLGGVTRRWVGGMQMMRPTIISVSTRVLWTLCIFQGKLFNLFTVQFNLVQFSLVQSSVSLWTVAMLIIYMQIDHEAHPMTPTQANFLCTARIQPKGSVCTLLFRRLCLTTNAGGFVEPHLFDKLSAVPPHNLFRL